ncbi:MAG: glutamyl-tRNA reductase [Deltaproteobacteria bacterium]|jgi:glutamyl-tRNA reductase|nr:glutamyl-tRNA reductase [Deltaproteobacteria bacterium]
MDIVVTGVSHRLAPVALRESLARCGLGEGRGLLKLCALGIISEGLVISTCNRVEIVAVSHGSVDPGSELLTLMAQATGQDESDLRPYVHLHSNLEAVGYLFRVASGLDSLVVGEPQILGQVKEAFRTATRYRTVGPIVSKLFHKSFQTAKRIRSETELASGAVSVASAATIMAHELLGGLEGKKAVIIGSGEIASLGAAHLKAKGVSSLVIYGRNLEKAQTLAKKVDATAKSLTELLGDVEKNLKGVDLLFSAASAMEPIITRSLLAWFSAKKSAGDKPVTEKLVVMDLGVPRNVEAAVENIPGVVLRNVDGLIEVVNKNQSLRQIEAKKASAIVDEEVRKFSHWLSSLATSPTIKDLIGLAEEARTIELERTMAKNGFSPEQKEALENMSRALVRRILHNPLTFAKGCHRHGHSDYRLDVFRRVFGLDP